jgi:ankyrin repeat protein
MDSPHKFSTICPPLNQANFPVVDDKGRTALMLASARNELLNVEAIILSCADSNLKRNQVI